MKDYENERLTKDWENERFCVERIEREWREKERIENELQKDEMLIMIFVSYNCLQGELIYY